jgi:hypothetical protein
MQIFVWTLTGKSVTFNVDPSTTVADALVAITRLEQRSDAEAAAIDLLARGVVFGGERLVVRSTGMSFDGTNMVSEMELNPLDPSVKVVLRKRFDDSLTHDDWGILELLQHEYNVMLQGQQRHPISILSENPIPAATCTIGCLRFDVQIVLGQPPFVYRSQDLVGLNVQGLAFEASSS